jgi:hypothetical protein
MNPADAAEQRPSESEANALGRATNKKVRQLI